MNINYSKELEALIANNKKLNIKPTLLLHACCAPCSSYCLEYLMDSFEITVLYYNPNISPESEYIYRTNEIKRLINEMTNNKVSLEIGNYEPDIFYQYVKGLENEPERGKRCEKCFELRLNYAANYAREHSFDYFTTTLSISPLKDARLLNEIGSKLSKQYGINYLYSDFKKKNGYIRSIELSKQYNLYRQNYCGCVFSKPKTDF